MEPTLSVANGHNLQLTKPGYISIVTVSRSGGRRARSATLVPDTATDGVIDVEFETVRPLVRSAAHRMRADAPADRTDECEHQIGVLKTVERARALPGPGTRIAYVASVFFASVSAFLVSGGHVLLRAPAAAPGAPTLELVAAAPETVPMRDDVLTVAATVRNAGRDALRVPDVLLTFPATEGDDRLVYRVARGETLEPGKSLAFTVRMPKKSGYAPAPSLRFDANGV